MDLGCNNGYVSRLATKDGYDITAIDFDKNMYDAQKHFKQIGLIPIRFINSSIESYISKLTDKYTVIALSLFHHYFENDTLNNSLNNNIIPFFNSKVNKLFIELLNDEERFYIISNTNFQHCELIYKDTYKNRNLYYMY